MVFLERCNDIIIKDGMVHSMNADAKKENSEAETISDKIRKTIYDEWKNNKDKEFCLCVGSGVTRRFVGTWTELLNKLLCARMVNRWLDNSFKPTDDLKSDQQNGRNLDGLSNIIQNMDKFNFFEGEGNLEQGDYLLSDDRKQNVFSSEEERQAWQEKYFSKQVSLILDKRIRDFCLFPLKGIKDSCKKKTCHKDCPVYNLKADNVADIFLNLKQAHEKTPFSNRKERQEVYSHCCLYHELSTLMAVSELCLSGAVRFVINYNFDCVLEQILADNKVLQLYGRSPDKKLHIHIWTYGDIGKDKASSDTTANSKKQVDNSTSMKASDLYQIHYHIGEEWIFQVDEKDEDAIHFFHVHGICGEPDEWLKSVDGTNVILPLVFSEHSYLEYQKAAFNWSNRTLSNLMSNFTIITVGFSGVDANFRAVSRAMKNSNLPSILAGKDEDIASKNSKVLPCPRIILLRAKKEHKGKFEKIVEESAYGPTAGHIVSDNLQVDQETVFSSVYERMVENYYRYYFDIAVYWEENFDQLAGFLMERTDSFSISGTT